MDKFGFYFYQEYMSLITDIVNVRGEYQKNPAMIKISN